MTPTQFAQIEALFHELSDAPPREREERLANDRLDPTVVAEVRRMLAQPRTPMEIQNAGLAAKAMRTPPGGEAADLVGTALGPYRIEEVVGEGGMGIVYRATQTGEMTRDVAVKVIKPGLDTREVIARFEGERQTLARMQHAGIAQVYDAGATEHGRPFFVMEYVPGRPVTEYCADRKLALRDRLGLFLEVCDAVQHAHQKGIIHRDLKPGNVLVTVIDERPVVKVIDFGIAKALEPEMQRAFQTRHEQLIGTPEYMSPEQADRRRTTVDTRSDVYSLGVLLYELISDRLPFDAASLRDQTWDQLCQFLAVTPPKSLRGQDPALARDLDWIVMRCLEKEPERRYPGVGALADDVRRYLAHEPVSAGPPSRLYRARKFVRRNQAAVAFASFALASLLIGVVLSGWGILWALQERDRAVSAAHDAREQKARAEELLELARLEQAANQGAMEFIQRVFLAQDPGRDTTRLERTAEDLLRSAARMLDEGALSERPLAAANTRGNIGLTFTGLGLYDEAIHQLRNALRDYREYFGTEDSGRIANTLNTLSIALMYRGDLEEAETLLRASIEMYKRLDPPGDKWNRGVYLSNLASIVQRRGRLTEAIELYREGLEQRRKIEAPDSPAMAEALNNLAFGLWQAGRLDEAAPLYSEALGILHQLHPDGHVNTASVLNNLGTVRLEQNRYAEAEANLEEALALRQALLPQRHPLLAQCHSNLAKVYANTGRLIQAQAGFKLALEMVQEALPPGHFIIAQLRENLGIVQLELGELEQAEQSLRRAAADAEAALGPNHASAVRAHRHLARCLLARDDPGAALAVLEPLLSWRGEGQPADEQLRARLRLTLADAYVLVDNRAAAARLLDDLKPIAVRDTDIAQEAAEIRDRLMAGEDR